MILPSIADIRSFAMLGIASFALAGCPKTSGPIPDLPAPEYEAPRNYEIQPPPSAEDEELGDVGDEAPTPPPAGATPAESPPDETTPAEAPPDATAPDATAPDATPAPVTPPG